MLALVLQDQGAERGLVSWPVSPVCCHGPGEGFADGWGSGASWEGGDGLYLGEGDGHSYGRGDALRDAGFWGATGDGAGYNYPATGDGSGYNYPAAADVAVAHNRRV